MKRFHLSAFLISVLLLTVWNDSVVAVFASGEPPSAQNTTTASAVVVPAGVSHLGFTIQALVKNVNVKEGDEVKAGQALVVLDMPDLEYAVAAAEAALRSAQSNAELQRYKRVKDIRNGRVFWDVVPPEVRQIADAQVASTQAVLEIAQASLAQGTLTAPYDGTVADINVTPGESVQSGQVVLTLATLDTLQIETTDLSERDITNVNIGDLANIFVGALNANLDGKVIGISPIADRVGGDVVYKVTIALEKPPAGLLWGMTAEVTIGK